MSITVQQPQGASSVNFKGNLIGKLPKSLEGYQAKLLDAHKDAMMDKIAGDIFMSTTKNAKNGAEELMMATHLPNGANYQTSMKLSNLDECPGNLVLMMNHIYDAITKVTDKLAAK